MRQEEIEQVRHLPLFASMEDHNRHELLKGAFLQRFPTHVELIREGEPPDFLHVVVEGQIEVFSRYRDRETTVAVLGPGASFILAAVVLDKPYLKSARVLSAGRILMIPAETVRAVFAQDAAFARALTQELAQVYRGVVKELKNQKLRSSLERTAAWIIRHDAERGDTGRFELPFDKKVLASRLGMAPEVLSRTFVTLKAYGVKVDGRRIEISDRSGLTKLAAPDSLIDDPVT
ncbi:MAG: cyclic nucleotide-binding domain-containing protein [Proteobacteria bacterium]|nr:cyclic nucleotide-binding domain-containing protein [Pseudomonadota bacterium]